MKRFKIWWKDGTTELIEGNEKLFVDTFTRTQDVKRIDDMDRWLEVCSCPPECIIVADHIDMKKVRQFVKVSDGRIGVVMAGEGSGGVFRGHCDIWFGEFNSETGAPLVEQLCIFDDWEEVDCSLGLCGDDLAKAKEKKNEKET